MGYHSTFPDIWNLITVLSSVAFGYLLNTFSRRGRLKIYVVSKAREYLKRASNGEYISSDILNDEIERVRFKIEINFYNGSQDYKNIHDECLILKFKNTNKAIKLTPLKPEIWNIYPKSLEGNLYTFIVEKNTKDDFNQINLSDVQFQYMETLKVKKHNLTFKD